MALFIRHFWSFIENTIDTSFDSFDRQLNEWSQSIFFNDNQTDIYMDK